VANEPTDGLGSGPRTRTNATMAAMLMCHAGTGTDERVM
jgi:hypothetical protein